MKRISICFTAVVLCAVVIFSCKKVKDGAPGPKGDQGNPGASGYTLSKAGSVVSDLSGTNTKDEDFSANDITYQYYGSADDNIFYSSLTGEMGDEDVYYIRIKRYDSTGTNFFMLEIELNETDTIARYIDFKYINTKNNIAFLDGYYYSLPFEDSKVQISNYSWDNVDFTFDNFKFDPAIGAISFGYNAVYRYDANSTGNEATLTGNVSATLGKAVLKQGSFE